MDRRQLGKMTKEGHIRYHFSNPEYSSNEREERIKRHLHEGTIEITPEMIIETNKLQCIGNEYKGASQSDNKTQKETPDE